ncbi:hypothetical protein [Marisediminicola sp. LYQ85]|uniref:hypothetical protein n=1 Tax=Marisediminicola sp. LYQ85 TaxID=3391062 RepID=UPI0039834ADF
MDFWQSFWATMWGALAGGAFSAFVAWLFALQLKGRDEEKQKSEQSATMRREWGEISYLFREHAQALRAMRPVGPLGVFRRRRLRRAKATLRALNRRLVEAASVARGPDSALVDALGKAANAHVVVGRVQFEALEVAEIRLLSLAVTPVEQLPDYRAETIELLDKTMAGLRVTT